MNPLSKTFAALMVAFFCLSGCVSPVAPQFCDSATTQAKSYCYARVNLNDLITAANLSREDGSLSGSSHDAFLAKAREADQLLDAAEIVLSGGGNAEGQVLLAKKLLLELQ